MKACTLMMLDRAASNSWIYANVLSQPASGELVGMFDGTNYP
jgi:hypothetical protein